MNQLSRRAILLLYLLLSSQVIASTNNGDIESFLDFKNKNFSSLPGVINKSNQLYIWESPQHLISHSIYGMVHPISTTIRSIHRTADKLIFDATYTTDKYSRRANLEPPHKNKKKFLALAGCSFVFGIGLNDQETLNHFINKDNFPSYAFNYGVAGGSINNFLARLIYEDNLEGQLNFETGDLVYVYINDHISRVVGAWPNLWTFESPYFKKNEKSELEYAGSISENMSWIRKKIVNNAESLPSFLKEKRFIPRITSSDYDYYCELLKDVDRRWRTKKNAGRFVVAFHPLIGVDEKILSCLKENNTEFFTSKIQIDHKSHTIPIDGHPTANLNQMFAREILDFLSKSK